MSINPVELTAHRVQQYALAKKRPLWVVSSTGLILIQASSAVMCGGKVAVP